MKNLWKLLNDHQTGMSKFQDDYLVTTRAGGTLYGQYKQALREVYKRFRGLRQQIANHKRLEIEIEELQFEISELEKSDVVKDNFTRRKKIVDLQEKTMLMEESTRAISDTKREFINFYRQAMYLKSEIGELTDERRDQLDTEMWIFRIKEMATIDFVTSGKLRNSTFEFIHALPEDLKRIVLPEIKNAGQLIDWYENKQTVIIPKDLSSIEAPNFKQLENLSCDNILPM